MVKVAKAVGMRAGLRALHPHALRHACCAELLRRTKNLRVVQEQLRLVQIRGPQPPKSNILVFAVDLV